MEELHKKMKLLDRVKKIVPYPTGYVSLEMHDAHKKLIQIVYELLES